MNGETFDLRLLRQATYELLIQNLKLGKKEHQEIRSAADQAQVEYAGRFLIELVQNACDAAHKAGLRDSAVKVIRTESAIYVANQGAPFDPKGIRSICSYGLTTKDAAVYVGNKGIGFKSVLDVTSSPEIYSGPTSSRSEFQYSFRLDRNVHYRLLTELRDFARSFLDHNDDVREKIQKNDSRLSPLELIKGEFSKIAYFKLPEDIDLAERAENDEDLCELATDPLGFVTIIKLPLRKDTTSTNHADRAFAQFRDEKGLTVLFMPSVKTIQVVEKTKGGRSFDLSKEVQSNEEGSPGVTINCVKTTFLDHSSKKEKDETDWIIVETKLGLAKRPQSQGERESLQNLVRNFPESWRDLREAELAVAMCSQSLSEVCTDGRYCLTFTSKQPTGFPFHVNGKFFGKMARTGVELTENPYNAYLAQEAAQMLEVLVDWLKSSDHITHRRLACLTYWHSKPTDGESHGEPLAETLLSGLHNKKVILGRDGHSFLSPFEATLPQSDKLDDILKIFGPELLAQYGFFLPDTELLQQRSDALRGMFPEGRPDLQLPNEVLLNRDKGHLSLLEAAAHKNRDAGAEWWSRFVLFLKGCFPLGQWFDEISKQKIWPVEKSSTAEIHLASARGQCAPTLFRRPRSPTLEQLEEGEALGGDELSDLPAVPVAISTKLAFLDEKCIPMTELRDGHVHLCAHTEYLSPRSREQQFIRLPRVRILVNDIIAPFFRRFLQLSEKAQQERKNEGWEVLAFLCRLVEGAKPGAELSDIQWGEIGVPVYLGDGQKTWRKAEEVYLSKEWLELPDGEYPEVLFQGISRMAYLLPPSKIIDGFKETGLSLGQSDMDSLRSFFISRLQLAEKPRMLVWNHNLKPTYSGFVDAAPSTPFEHPAFETHWENYFKYLAGQRRRYETVSYGYEVVVYYIDGCLEIVPEHRSQLFRTVMRAADYYSPKYLNAFIEKQGGATERIKISSFWLHALRSLEWVPCYRACQPGKTERSDVESLAKPHDVWILNPNEIKTARNTRYQFLSYLPEGNLSGSEIDHGFCKTLGLHDFEASQAEELVDLLSKLVQYADSDATSAVQMVALKSLTEEIWQKLGTALLENEAQAQSIVEPIFSSDRILLEVEGELKTCAVANVLHILLNDDPERYTFFSQLPDKQFLPFPPARRRIEGWRQLLVQTLTKSKPELFVSLSSSSDKPHFQEITGDRIDLRRYLEETIFPGVPVWKHLFVLYATAGINPVDPTKEAFRKTCRSLESVKVVHVRFDREQWSAPVFLDYPTPDGRRLLLLDPDRALHRDILTALTPLFGGINELVLADYASQVRRSRADPTDAAAAEQLVNRYVKNVGQGVVNEVHTALIAGEQEVIEVLEPIAIAARYVCTHHGAQSIPSSAMLKQLRGEWSEFVKVRQGPTRDSIIRDLAHDFIQKPVLEDLLRRTNSYDDRKLVTAWAEHGINPDLLNACLLSCHHRILRFSENAEKFHMEDREFIAAFMGICAILSPPGSSVQDYDAVVETLRTSSPRDEVLADLFLDKEKIRTALQSVATRALRAANIRSLPVALERFVSQPLGEGPLTSGIESLIGARIPDRVVQEYYARPAETRSIDAQQLWQDYKWALALVLKGEGLERGEGLKRVEDDVAVFLDGQWANPSVLLNRLGETIKLHYAGWNTSRNQHLFRRCLHRAELEKWLVESSYLEPPKIHALAQIRQMQILGKEMSKQEFESQAGRGQDGEIWRTLSQAVSKAEINPVQLLSQQREQAEQKTNRPHKSRTGGGTSRADRTIPNEYVGAIGELFVYLRIRDLITTKGGDLGDIRWVSRSRETFGMPEGNDELGYDIEFIDLQGVFGEVGRTCFLEVKSTSGDGSGAFQMSLAEWTKARECESEESAAYIIVRVGYVLDPSRVSIVALFETPCDLWRRGIIAVDPAGFYMWYGAAISENDSDT